LTLPFPRLALNKIGDRVGIDNMTTVEAWMHPCQKQAYEEIGQLVSVIQKQAKDEALDMYFGDNMQMAGAPVRISFMWDKTRIDFIAKKVWGRVEVKKPGFYDVEGRRIFEVRGATGGVVTAQLFYLAVVMNLYVNNPAACSYIDTLTVTAGY
jgi:gamma-glutamylcysteine synthetase